MTQKLIEILKNAVILKFSDARLIEVNIRAETYGFTLLYVPFRWTMSTGRRGIRFRAGRIREGAEKGEEAIRGNRSRGHPVHRSKILYVG